MSSNKPCQIFLFLVFILIVPGCADLTPSPQPAQQPRQTSIPEEQEVDRRN